MAEYKSALAIGTVVRGEKRTYIIRKILGQGGFGITYMAECQVDSVGKPVTVRVALKEHFILSLCSRDNATNHIEYSEPVAAEVNGSLKAFLREAVRLRELGVDHPNIVKIDEVFQANNTAYYAMELLEDGTLDNRVATTGPMSADEVRQMFKPIIAAVATLHSNKIAHYDIKPANIMLRREWNGGQTPVLIDFGLAKHYDNSGHATSTLACGGYSSGYAPVEQYRGIREFSPACDVYAIAATMYYCLTGRAPLDAFDIRLDEVERELLPVAGRYLTDIIVSSLANRVRDRIPDAVTLYDRMYRQGTSTDNGGSTAAGMPRQTPHRYETKRVNNRSKKSGNGLIVLIAVLAVVAVGMIAMILGSFNSNSDYAVADEDTMAVESVAVEEVPYDSVVAADEGPSAEEVAAFVRNFKNKFMFGPWEPVGDPDENNAGDCETALLNESNVTLDGSDYKVQFKYEHLYAGPAVHSETVTKRGVTLRPGEMMTITHYYTDDCGPLSPKLVFTITDEEIYRKYHSEPK